MKGSDCSTEVKDMTEQLCRMGQAENEGVEHMLRFVEEHMNRKFSLSENGNGLSTMSAILDT